MSDATRRVRDEERRELAFEARRIAWAIITNHRAQLDALANELLEHEVLEREQIDRIMGDVPPIPGGRPSFENGYLGTTTPHRGSLDDEAALQLDSMLGLDAGDPSRGEVQRRMDDDAGPA